MGVIELFSNKYLLNLHNRSKPQHIIFVVNGTSAEVKLGTERKNIQSDVNKCFELYSTLADAPLKKTYAYLKVFQNAPA